jgi:hypothetical protein
MTLKGEKDSLKAQIAQLQQQSRPAESCAAANYSALDDAEPEDLQDSEEAEPECAGTAGTSSADATAAAAANAAAAPVASAPPYEHDFICDCEELLRKYSELEQKMVWHEQAALDAIEQKSSELQA